MLKLIKKEEKRGIAESSHLQNCKVGLCSLAISFFYGRGTGGDVISTFKMPTYSGPDESDSLVRGLCQ